MASSLTHIFVACAAGKICTHKRMPLRFWILAIGCSLIPDADVIGFSFGISYGDFLGHRGFFHSIFFAVVLSLLVTSIFYRKYSFFTRRWWKYFLFFLAVGASHGILDALTNGGMGVAVLAPFDNSRYFFPWQPLEVSPIGPYYFFSKLGLVVLLSEIRYVWTPLLILWILSRLIRYKWYGSKKVLNSRRTGESNQAPL